MTSVRSEICMTELQVGRLNTISAGVYIVFSACPVVLSSDTLKMSREMFCQD